MNIDPRTITQEQLAEMGAQGVAYVRPLVVNGANVWGIFAGDGTQLAIVPTREAAVAALLQNDLEPVTLH